MFLRSSSNVPGAIHHVFLFMRESPLNESGASDVIYMLFLLFLHAGFHSASEEVCPYVCCVSVGGTEKGWFSFDKLSGDALVSHLISLSVKSDQRTYNFGSKGYPVSFVV